MGGNGTFRRNVAGVHNNGTAMFTWVGGTPHIQNAQSVHELPAQLVLAGRHHAVESRAVRDVVEERADAAHDDAHGGRMRQQGLQDHVQLSSSVQGRKE